MDNLREVSRTHIDIEKAFKTLKKICEGKDERNRIKASEWIVKNLHDSNVYSLLEKLAVDSYYCKMQALFTISKMTSPDEKIIKILNSLFQDSDYSISMEASKILSNLISIDNNDFEIANRLLNGGYEAKIRALDIYRNCWEYKSEEIISILENLIIQERNNFPIFIKILDLLGFLGKKYPKRIIEIFKKICINAETVEKSHLFMALKNFTKENPFEVLSFLSFIEKHGDFDLKKNIPEILCITIDDYPDLSFELFLKLANNKNRMIRSTVLHSLYNIKDIYPEETLKILLYLWKNISRNSEIYYIDYISHIKEIKDTFSEIGKIRPDIAISFCQELANCNELEKRKDAIEIASSFASISPEKFFSFLETFVYDHNYEIKINAISFFKGQWNIFPLKTINLLIKIDKKERLFLKEEIENKFSPKVRHNSNKVILNLADIFIGNLANIFDTIYDLAHQLQPYRREIPQELLMKGEKKILIETVSFLISNKIQEWDESIDYLEKFSMHPKVPVRIISLRILPLFLPKNLEIALNTLERLLKDHAAEVREESFILIKYLMKQYPQEVFSILVKIQNCQDKNVRKDIVRWIIYFKDIFPKESLQIIEKFSGDTDTEVREEVVNNISSFFYIFPQEIMDIAGKLCEDDNEMVVKLTFDFLEQILDKNSADVLNLIQKLYKHCNGPIREKISSFLGKFELENPDEILDILSDLAKDEIRSVQSCAFSSLDKIGKSNPEATFHVIEILGSEQDPEIRRNVIKSLRILGESLSFDLACLKMFLNDSADLVQIELAITLGKIGKFNPRMAQKMYKTLLQHAENKLDLKEALAEAMTNFGEYCPYEAFKILSYLRMSKSENVTTTVNSSVHALKNELNNFTCIYQAFFGKPSSKIDQKELKKTMELICKRIIYRENDHYSKQISEQYQLFDNLLKFSTISRINKSETLLSYYLNHYHIIDESIEKGLIALKNITKLLGKQNYYTKRDDKIVNIKDCLELLDKTERNFRNEFKEFDNPDKFIFESILNTWRNIISIEFIKLRGNAEIKIKLESTKIRRREKTILRLKLSNEGTSKAENIITSIIPSNDFIILGPPDKNIKILSPNNSEILEFIIKIKTSENSIRAAFSINFDDAEKGGKILDFADQIKFVATNLNYHEIKNPYIPGKPLTTSEMFYGRDELLENIEKTLVIPDRTHILILHGQRRTGKTSILYQLKIRLKDTFIPVLLDFQGLADPGTDTLFFWIAKEIWKEFKEKEITVTEPILNQFKDKPAILFREYFFSEIQGKLKKQKIILMMDEFELIDDKIKEGVIDKNVLSFLRNIMQHSNQVEFIFSGTHRLEEMSSNYWSILFNIGLYYHISFLEKDEAIKLICDPVQDSLEFDPLAIEKILEMTAGHPYFIQLVCYYLVEYQKKNKRNYTTIEDVNDVLDKVVIGGTPHFQYIWDGLTRIERIVLLTLTRVLRSQNTSGIEDIIKYLQNYHFEISEETVKEIFQKYLNDNTLEQKTVNNFQFKVKLIQHWFEKNKKLHEIMEEKING